LDTNGKPNLSTRVDDIISWSKEMFIGIVGDEKDVKQYMLKNFKSLNKRIK
jgi:hypothetical protein